MRKIGARLAGILLLAAITLLVYKIWSLSLENGAISEERSTALLESGLALINKNELSASAYDRLARFLRKSAHFLEFALLGFVLQWFWAAIRRLNGHTVLHGLFAGLLVAVIDEGLQLRSGRVAQVQDILLDFSGVVLGSLAMLALFGLWRLMTRRRRRSVD